MNHNRHHADVLPPEEERNATVAVSDDLQLAENAVRALEHAGFEMSHLSIIAKGMNTERHVIGFDTRIHREGHWARWGGLWGVLFGGADSVEMHLGDAELVT